MRALVNTLIHIMYRFVLVAHISRRNDSVIYCPE